MCLCQLRGDDPDANHAGDHPPAAEGADSASAPAACRAARVRKCLGLRMPCCRSTFALPLLQGRKRERSQGFVAAAKCENVTDFQQQLASACLTDGDDAQS